MHKLFLIFCVFPPKKPKIKYKPNRNFLSQTNFEKAKIQKFGLKKAKLAILLTRSPTLVKTCPLFFNAHVQNTPSIRHFWRHIDAIWQVSPALLTFRRHLPVTKADVLLTFCTYKVLYTKKAGGKNCRGNLLGGVLMETMRCARRHARGHQHQRCRHGVGLLVDYLFCGPSSQVVMGHSDVPRPNALLACFSLRPRPNSKLYGSVNRRR